MRSVIALAAALASVAVAQDGLGGNFCGNTLGNKKALADPIKGTGKLTFTGRPPVDVTLLDGQIITTLLGANPSLTAPAAPMVKMTECIYDIAVNFKTNQLTLATGPPNVPKAGRRCWVFEKKKVAGDEVLGFNIYSAYTVKDGAIEPGSCTTEVAAGSIDLFTTADDAKDIPKALQPGCEVPAPENDPTFAVLGDLVVAGSQMWMNRKLVATTADVHMMVPDGTQRDYLKLFGVQVWQQCLTEIRFNPAFDTKKPIPVGLVVSAPPDATGATMCIQAELNPVFGLAQVEAGVPAASAPVCPSVATTSATFSVAFKTLPALVAEVVKAATAAAGVTVANVTNFVQSKRDVMETTISLPSAGVTDPTKVLNPCSIFLMRSGLATAMKVNVLDVKLTGVVIGFTPFALATDSAANMISAACPASAARRLRSLVEEEHMAALVGRQLQAAPLSANVQIVAANAAAAGALVTQFTTLSGGSGLAGALAPFGTAAGASTAGAGATAPAATTATVVALPVPISRPVKYVPSDDIKQFHSIPRFSVMGGSAPSNKFETSVDYVQGALGPAGGIIAFGVIFFIVYILSYLFGCCKCCCRKCRPKRDPVTYYATGCRKNCGTPRALVVMAIINAALLLSVIAYLPRFTRGINDVFVAANDFATILTDTGDLMRSTGQVPAGVNGALMDSMKTACTKSNTNAVGLLANINGYTGSNPTPQTVTDIITSLRDGTATARDLAEDVGKTLGSAGTDFKKSLEAVPIDMIQSSAALAGYVVLGFLALVILFWSVMVCKSSCAACVYKFSSPIVILLTLLVTILAGVYYAVGIIGADVCIDPSTTLLSVLGSSMSKTSDEYGSLEYYLTCGDKPAMKPLGAAKLIIDAVDQISLAAEQTASLNSQVETDRTGSSPVSSPFEAIWTPAGGSPAPANPTLLTAASLGLDGARNAITTIAEEKISCKSIDGILQRLFVALCNDGFGTVIAIFRIIMAAAVLLICQLGVGVDVCCYHPGDAGAWGGADDKSAGMDSGMTVRTAPAPAGSQPVPGAPPAVGAAKV